MLETMTIFLAIQLSGDQVNLFHLVNAVLRISATHRVCQVEALLLTMLMRAYYEYIVWSTYIWTALSMYLFRCKCSMYEIWVRIKERSGCDPYIPPLS